MKIYLLLGIFVLTGVSMAAVAKKGTANIGLLPGAGAVHGGQAGLGFTLLGIKTVPGKNKEVERIVFETGNRSARPLLGQPGYFNVENDPAAHRVVVDFHQTLNSKFEERELKKVFARSSFVRSGQMIFEPQGQMMTLVLDLKKNASIRVIPVAGTEKRTASLILDFFDNSVAEKKSAASKIEKAK